MSAAWAGGRAGSAGDATAADSNRAGWGTGRLLQKIDPEIITPAMMIASGLSRSRADIFAVAALRTRSFP